MNCSGGLAQAIQHEDAWEVRSTCSFPHAFWIWVQPGSSVVYLRAPSAVVWGQHLCWLSGQLPLGHGNVALLAAHLELGRVVRLPCQIPEAPCLLMKRFWMQVLTNEDFAFGGVNYVGKKLSWKVNCCIILYGGYRPCRFYFCRSWKCKLVK